MPQHSLEPGGFVQRLGPLLFLAGLFFINFTTRISFAPLLPNIEADLGLSHAQAGSLFLFVSLGYFVAILCSGFVSQRLGHRRTIIISAVSLGLVVMLASQMPGRWGITLGCVGLGLTAGLYLPSGMATLTALIKPSDWGRALAVHELAPNLGFVAAPLVAELLLDGLSWRGVLALLGAGSVVMGLAYARWGQGGDFPGQAPNLKAIGKLLRLPNLWLMVALFSLGIAGTLGIFTMLPLYLVSERGWDQGWANFMLSMSRVSCLVVTLFAGWAYDRLGARPTMAVIFLSAGAASIGLGLAGADWLVIFLFVQPALGACFFPAGFATLSAVVPPDMRGLAISLCTPLAFLLGSGVVPALIGLLGEHYSFGIAIALCGVLITCGAAVVPFLKLPARTG